MPLPRFILRGEYSINAKLLYALLLGRTQLSQKSGWVSEDENVYVIYTIRQMANDLNRSERTVKAALAELQVPELKERRARPYVARLFYAYADVLEELGRTDDAREYFARASSVDREGMTDADERLAALEGVELVDHDVEDGVVWTDVEEDADQVAEADERKGRD